MITNFPKWQGLHSSRDVSAHCFVWMAAILLNIPVMTVPEAIVSQKLVASQAACDVGDHIFACFIWKSDLVHQLFVVFKKVSWNFWLPRSLRPQGPFIKTWKQLEMAISCHVWHGFGRRILHLLGHMQALGYFFWEMGINALYRNAWIVALVVSTAIPCWIHWFPSEHQS